MRLWTWLVERELPLAVGDGLLRLEQHCAVLAESEGGEVGQGGGQEGGGEGGSAGSEDGDGRQTSSKLYTELDQ